MKKIKVRCIEGFKLSGIGIETVSFEEYEDYEVELWEETGEFILEGFVVAEYDNGIIFNLDKYFGLIL